MLDTLDGRIPQIGDVYKIHDGDNKRYEIVIIDIVGNDLFYSYPRKLTKTDEGYTSSWCSITGIDHLTTVCQSIKFDKNIKIKGK